MYAFKRVMIGLDFTLMDKGLIQFASALARLIEPEDIFFVNIQPSLELPEDLQEEFPMFRESPEAQLRQELRALLVEHFPHYEAWQDRLHPMVIQGSPRKELLRQTHDLDIDLLVMGQKATKHGSGVVPTQVARKADCSVLFLPEHPPQQLRRILIGCDFSEPSKLALEEAISLRQRTPKDVDLTLLHAYQVPMGYYKTGRTEAQFAALMHQHAEKRLAKFVDEHHLDLKGVHHKFVYAKKQSAAAILHQEAKKMDVDLIIVAARGLGGLSALFLGSTTEKIIKQSLSKAILVVKQKGQQQTLRELIEQI